MLTTYLLIILTGFVGSFHCAAMCGPFLGYFRIQGGARSSHLAYQAGRLSAYLVLGALAGTLGGGIFFASATVGLQRGLMVAMGLSMIAVGISYYLPQRFVPSVKTIKPIHWLRSQIGLVNGHERAALLGLLTTLMPCGYLYAYALAAVATANPLAGMATMGAFWLGTLPALLGVSWASNHLATRLPFRLARLTPILLMLLGLLALTGKWQGLTAGPNHESHCLTSSK